MPWEIWKEEGEKEAANGVESAKSNANTKSSSNTKSTKKLPEYGMGNSPEVEELQRKLIDSKWWEKADAQYYREAGKHLNTPGVGHVPYGNFGTSTEYVVRYFKKTYLDQRDGDATVDEAFLAALEKSLQEKAQSEEREKIYNYQPWAVSGEAEKQEAKSSSADTKSNANTINNTKMLTPGMQKNSEVEKLQRMLISNKVLAEADAQCYRETGKHLYTPGVDKVPYGNFGSSTEYVVKFFKKTYLDQRDGDATVDEEFMAELEKSGQEKALNAEGKRSGINGILGAGAYIDGEWREDADQYEFGKDTDTYNILKDLENRWQNAPEGSTQREQFVSVSEEIRRLARAGTPIQYTQLKIENQLRANTNIAYDFMKNNLINKENQDPYLWFVSMTCSSWDYKYNNNWRVQYSYFNGIDMDRKMEDGSQPKNWTPWMYFDGMLISADKFANLNLGYIGTKMGFKGWQLLNPGTCGAGDAFWIQYGIDMANNGR